MTTEKQAGDVVRFDVKEDLTEVYIGIITCTDSNKIGNDEECMVRWIAREVHYHTPCTSITFLAGIKDSREPMRHAKGLLELANDSWPVIVPSLAD